MGRKPCCNKDEVTKGAWTNQEDRLLSDYIVTHGEGKWRSLPLKAGLKRCGKSCRLRWLNYLKPDIKRGNITLEEEDLIIELHKKFGNRWSLIAEQLPGRTDNEIKNYWNTSLKRKILNDGSKLELSPKNKKAQSRKRTTQVESTDIVMRAKPSPCTEITLSGPTSEQNSEQDSSSSTNIWENLLEDLELDSETKVQKNILEIGSMETSMSIISNDSFQWNAEEIWKNEVDTPPFSGCMGENEGDWCGWLESFDAGSFSSFPDEDLWASELLIL